MNGELLKIEDSETQSTRRSVPAAQGSLDVNWQLFAPDMGPYVEIRTGEHPSPSSPLDNVRTPHKSPYRYCLLMISFQLVLQMHYPVWVAKFLLHVTSSKFANRIA